MACAIQHLGIGTPSRPRHSSQRHSYLPRCWHLLWSICLGLILVGAPVVATVVIAQVPTIDKATLAQATATAQTTRDIMGSNRQIQEQTQKILQAVSGARSDPQSFANAALGGGFQFGQAPSMSQVLGGGMLQFGQMGGQFQQAASTIINGLMLAKSLSGLLDANKKSSNEAAYASNVNTAGALAAVIAGTQSAQSARSSTFQGFGQQIGQSQDIKGSIDQNTQVGLQHALTTNEMIGTINALNTAEQAKLQKRLAEESGTADLMRYQPTGGNGSAPQQNPTGNTTIVQRATP
jgi:Type IV secretion system proteins